jgi:arsenical pump membrane protein
LTDVTLLPLVILLLTLALVIWQPRGLGIGFSAVGGALLALATGVVTLQDISTVWALAWNPTATTIALLIISLVLDAAGFFRWLALLLAQASSRHGRLFFLLVIILGALITALLTNLGTVLIWTPAVMDLLLVLGFGRKAMLAFVFGIGFMADATSLPFPMSNLVNFISTEYFQISVWRYMLVMIPVNFVAIATGIGVLWFYFDRDIPRTYSLARMPPPDSAIGDPLVCQWSFAVLAVLLTGYFFAQPLGMPVALSAGLSALVMLALAGRFCSRQESTVISLSQIWRQVPWQVILFSLGMYVIACGVCNTDLPSLLSHLLQRLSGWGLTQVAMGTGFLATLLSGLTNNLSAVLINALGIQDVFGLDPAVREVMVYSYVIGCIIGAKITPIGSLATLLWLDMLGRKGQLIRWGEYVRIVSILTIPVLFVSLLSLAIWLPWLIA